jgi:hypothetical protein
VEVELFEQEGELYAPDPAHAPVSKLEGAYYKADKAIQNIVDLLAAA